MTSLTIHLQDPYLVLQGSRNQSSASTSCSSSSASLFTNSSSTSTTAASMEQVSPLSSLPSSTAIDRLQSTALLKGVLILTISRPIKVASLAVTLNGSSHLALSRTSTSQSLQTIDKRVAHYSRQHFRAQQFLIEPSPDPDHFTTIVAPSASSTSIHTDGVLHSGYSLNGNQIAYPFAIKVPHNVPVSVTTPHGGTIYRLSAELTMAKSRGASSGIKALLSAATGVGSSAMISAVTTVYIYRAGFLRHPPGSIQTPREMRAAPYPDTGGSAGNPCCNRPTNIEQQAVVERNAALGQSIVDVGPRSCSHICAAQLVDEEDSNDDSDNDESALVPDSTTHTWPDLLEATVSIPYVHLPPKSQPDIRVRVKLLGTDNITVKTFQASLYERVIFRVAKTINVEKGVRGKQTSMSIVGIRERAVSIQRMTEGWRPASGSSPRQIERVCQFSIPSTIREPNELYSSRNCNASTYGRISKSALRRLKEDEGNPSVNPSEVEYGAIDIEVQHFLRFSLFLTEPILSTAGSPVERHVGDIPVVVRGVPGEPRCDSTGLPSYLDSFSTSIPSLDEEQTYEAATRASLSGECIGGSEGIAVDVEGEHYDHNRDSMLSLASLIGLRPSDEDLENDDAFMAVMGLQGSRTPPRYEDSIGRPSLDTIISTVSD